VQRHITALWALVCTFLSFETSKYQALPNKYCCSLNGLGAGPAETAQPTIIADIIFLHDRGKYQALYFAFYFGSLTASTKD
jgi:hypothetical protein